MKPRLMKPLTAALVLVLLAGCRSSSAGLPDKDELQAMADAAGQPSDPDEYEITNFRCEPDPSTYEQLTVTFNITSTSQRSRYFDFDLYMEDSAGNRYNYRRVPGDAYLEPGETAEWSAYLDTDDTPDDAVCRMTIVDSVVQIIDDSAEDQ